MAVKKWRKGSGSVSYTCCGSILSLVKIVFFLFKNHYHTLPQPKPKENEIQTKDKIKPQLRYLKDSAFMQ